MMKKNPGIILLSLSYILMLLVMFALPFIIPEYSIIENTIDDMGAQASPYSWLVNLTMISLAAGSIISGWPYFEGQSFHRSILSLSGILQILAAIFNYAPVDPLISYNITESGLHEYFACSAVFSYSILSIATAFLPGRQHDKLLAALSGVSSTILLILTSESGQMAGIWNRLLLIIVFGWQIYCFNKTEI